MPPRLILGDFVYIYIVLFCCFRVFWCFFFSMQKNKPCLLAKWCKLASSHTAPILNGTVHPKKISQQHSRRGSGWHAHPRTLPPLCSCDHVNHKEYITYFGLLWRPMAADTSYNSSVHYICSYASGTDMTKPAPCPPKETSWPQGTRL